MKHTFSPRWSRLDNAAKIFPSNSSAKDSKVFRFFCELEEPVDRSALQTALDETLRQFPFYCAVIKKGLFWNYLEDSDLRPTVTGETLPPCHSLYDPDRKTLLFRVFSHGRRINLELYHALSDGTGALQFLQTLVYQYLLLQHAGAFSTPPPMPAYGASQSQRWDDSFQKYYEKRPLRPSPGVKGVYRLKGERLPENRVAVVEGRLSVQALRAQAKARGVTLTEFLTAVLLQAIHSQMRLRDARRPVTVTVPVNLRNYFPSSSVRNFFATINVPYDFSRQPDDLDAVAAHVKGCFQENLTREKLCQRMNTPCSLEHSLPIRLIPLALKNRVLHLATQIAGRQTTASFSNVGRVEMPAELAPYLRLFGAFTSPGKLQVTACSFGDRYVVCFAGPYREQDVERAFFQTLTGLGLAVEITASLPPAE